jgi:serine/threonine protein kinase
MQYEMATGKHPFDATNEGALIRKIIRGTYAPVQQRSQHCVDLVDLCLTHDFRRRPDTATLLKHPVIQNKVRATVPRSPSLTPKSRRKLIIFGHCVAMRCADQANGDRSGR